MMALRTFPAQVPLVKADGSPTQQTLQTLLTLIEAVRELQAANAALEARLVFLEP